MTAAKIAVDGEVAPLHHIAGDAGKDGALGLAETVPEGHVVGVDPSELKSAQRAAVLLGHQNLSWIVADGRSLPFHNAVLDAVLCHSVLETSLLQYPPTAMAGS